MPRVELRQYTSFGNSFVLVDETENPKLDERHMRELAHATISPASPFGADNLLILQRCTDEVLERINTHRGYWGLSAEVVAEYVFRMFEPDGEEAFSCGNGLVCVAHHLHTHHGIAGAVIATEIPSNVPRARSIGRSLDGEGYRANLGEPCRLPDALSRLESMTPSADAIGELRDFVVGCDFADSRGRERTVTLPVTGFLTHTGEPHLVFFRSEQRTKSAALEEIWRLVLGAPGDASTGASRWQKGTRALHRIGLAFNGAEQSWFPRGINVDFASVTDDGAIEYRCFERGIRRETMACGTGAVAVAAAARHLGLLNEPSVRLRPLRARANAGYRDAELRVTREPTGEWWLESDATPLSTRTAEVA
jgi:diaminopimelate epimerase